MVRGFNFRIWEEELNYLYSENKGADQIRGNREADLRLCLRICLKPGFSCRGSYITDIMFIHVSLYASFPNVSGGMSPGGMNPGSMGPGGMVPGGMSSGGMNPMSNPMFGGLSGK